MRRYGAGRQLGITVTNVAATTHAIDLTMLPVKYCRTRLTLAQLVLTAVHVMNECNYILLVNNVFNESSDS